jgi:hypothetical protein
MRSILVGIAMMTACAAGLDVAQAQENAQARPGGAYLEAPVGHRQPTREDQEGTASRRRIEQDSEQLNASTQNDVDGVDDVRSHEDALARKIELENDELDRELRGICRGC